MKRAQEKRIRSRKEISGIIKNGQSWECPFFRIISVSGLQKNRLAVLVSKRHGNAVFRNRLKRVSREVFRSCDSTNPPFADILIMPRVGAFLTVAECLKYYHQWKNKAKSVQNPAIGI